MELHSSPIVNLEETFNRLNYCFGVCTEDMTIVGINEPFARLHGCEPKDFIGKKPIDMYPDFEKSVFFECCLETIKTGNTISRVGYSVPLNGWYAIRTTKLDEKYYVLIAHEISKDQNYAGFVPIHDTLTSLYNRHKFEDDLKNYVSKKEPFGLLIVDVLKLKKINEIYGVFPADMLLMEIAGKIKLNIYQRNSLQIYRIAPDKFAIITNLNKQNSLGILQQISSIFNEPFKISNDVIKVNIAIGFNYIENFNKNSFFVIEETENALDLAKSKKVLYVEHNDNIRLINKQTLITEIKEAFKNNEFVLYYQPQIDCIKNKICGVESLIRWNHKTKGILPPAHFIEAIEDFDLNEQLDKYVLRKSMEDSRYFTFQGANLPISINLTTSSFSNSSILDFFDDVSTKLGVDNSLLTIEITESSLMESIELSQKVITSFSAKGLKIAVDDFGAGYSSFGYLVRYPTDYLKIDREFIADIHKKNNLKQIVLNLIKMAHSLNMIVIAEGVEVEEEAQVLKKYGCDIIQGFFYGKPMPKEQLLVRIKKEGISNFKSDFF